MPHIDIKCFPRELDEQQKSSTCCRYYRRYYSPSEQ